MVSLREEFPLTALFSLLGFIIGSLIVPYTSLIRNIIVSQQNIFGLTLYFNEILTLTLQKIFIGIVFGLILGAIGLVLDFIRKDSE
jgi:hypothetical protein